LERAAQAGITFVAGSGDSGPTDGATDGKPHVDFPASSPWTLAVGGTMIVTDATAIRSEVAWNNLAEQEGGTGTGVSAVFPMPAWQQNVREARSGSGRSIPDVSMNASPRSGYVAMVDGQQVVMGGSSASAPLWAGLIALLNQGLGRNVGFLNETLYKGVGRTDGFNPVPRGEGIQSQPGWTMVTGWGTPDGKKLLAALNKVFSPPPR
jgi:kumamolisin